MGWGFQRRSAATALLISTAMTLLGAPAQAQEIGSAVRGLTGQSNRLGPPPAPARVPRDPDLITNPGWDVLPQPVFPEAAATAAQEGRVTLECIALPTGFMRDCRVMSETPEGLGFGVSALIAARAARISPYYLAGTNPDAKVHFTIRFTIPSEPPDQSRDAKAQRVTDTAPISAPTSNSDAPGG